jgi:phosphohistidine phosphatase
MARQLWLLRHADAEPHGTRTDFERRLTERGGRQARLAGVALGRIGVEFQALLSSPRERALRTATLVAQALADSRSGPQSAGLQIHEPLSGGFDAPGALAVLEDLVPPAGGDGRVLLVGHEPDLSTVVGELTGARIDLKKGGLTVVRVDGASGELVALLRPSELALIAEGRVAAGAPAP